MSVEQATPFGLTKDQVEMIKTLLVHPGFQIMLQKVYPQLKESLINKMLNSKLTNDELHALRGEIRALNQYMQQPLIFMVQPKT